MPKTPVINLQILQQLAQELMFELNEAQCKTLLLDFKVFAKQLTIIKNINTNHVQPMDYPLPIVNTFLRSDNIEEPLSAKQVLALAPTKKQDYITIKQVISYEN